MYTLFLVNLSLRDYGVLFLFVLVAIALVVMIHNWGKRVKRIKSVVKSTYEINESREKMLEDINRLRDIRNELLSLAQRRRQFNIELVKAERMNKNGRKIDISHTAFPEEVALPVNFIKDPSLVYQDEQFLKYGPKTSMNPDSLENSSVPDKVPRSTPAVIEIKPYVVNFIEVKETPEVEALFADEKEDDLQLEEFQVTTEIESVDLQNEFKPAREISVSLYTDVMATDKEREIVKNIRDPKKFPNNTVCRIYLSEQSLLAIRKYESENIDGSELSDFSPEIYAQLTNQNIGDSLYDWLLLRLKTELVKYFRTKTVGDITVCINEGITREIFGGIRNLKCAISSIPGKPAIKVIVKKLEIKSISISR